MPQYTAVLTCDGPIRTGTTHGFRLVAVGHRVQAEVRTWVEPAGDSEDGWMYQGLRLVLNFRADEDDTAFHVIEEAGTQLLDELSLAAAAEAPPFHLQALYVRTQSSEELRVIRFLADLGLPTAKIRKAYLSHIDPLISGIMEDPSGAAQRLMRGMRWYRRALGQRNTIDRFLMLWIAVESLDPRLREHWGLEPDKRTCRDCDEVLICAKCESDQGKQNRTLGVERLLQEVPDGDEDTASNCSRLRNGIVHAYEELPDVHSRARKLVPILETAFPTGVAVLLDLSADERESLSRAPLEVAANYDAAVEVRLSREGGLRFGPPGAFPYLEVGVEPDVSFTEQGEPVSVSYSANILAHTAEDVSIEYLEGWVPTRFGRSFPITDIVCETSQEGPWLGEEAKGVSLWAEGDEEPRYPDAMRLE